MTAPRTFPLDANDQVVQVKVMAAQEDVARLNPAPPPEATPATATPPGLQTFTPGSSQDTTATFTNTTGAPATGVKLSISAPKGWAALASGSATFAGPVAPGSTTSATSKVTPGQASFNGALVATAGWTN